MEKHSIDQVSKIVFIAVTLANCAGTALEDGKIGLGDFGVLLKLGQVAPLFAEVDFSKALPQLGDLSPVELATLKSDLSKLELPNDALEQKIEQLLGAAGDLYIGIKKFLAIVKPA